MAKYCVEDCVALCDFCINYTDDSKVTGGNFEGEGFCSAKNIRVDCLDMCEDDFHCFNVKES